MSPRRVGPIGCAAALALVFGTAPPNDEKGPRLTLASADGGFSLANSRGGGAIFSASGIGPGEIVSGSVRISNTGGLPGAVTLSDSNIVDTPGPGGGSLSDRLLLRVTDDTAGAPGQILYGGNLGALPDLSLGVFQAGRERTYGFLVHFPEGESALGPASGDNAFAEASVEVSYHWTAVSVDGSSPGTPPPAADDRAPLVRLRVQRARRLLRGGYLVVLARCDEQCRLSGRARWRIARKQIPARIRERGVPASRWARLKVGVPRRARRSLRSAAARGRHLSLRLEITARDAAGNKRCVHSRIPRRLLALKPWRARPSARRQPPGRPGRARAGRGSRCRG